MLSCLIDKIGIRGCGNTTPHSGLYVNSLPGMSLKSIEYLTNAERSTFMAVWADVQIRAIARLQLDVNRQFAKKYKIKTISQSVDIGKVIDSTQITAAANEYRGLFFDLDYYTGMDDNYKTSALQSHYIQTLSFYSPINQAASLIKVFDYDLNTEIDSFTQDFVTGWNTIQVNKAYSERRIVIVVDSTNFDSVALNLASSLIYCMDCGARIQGVSFDTSANVQTALQGTNSYGLSAVYGVRCKYDNVVCGNQDVFYLGLWYLLGSELMQERLSSDRVNQYTVDRKQAAELKAVYDTEFSEAIASAIYGIELSESDCCLECDARYNVRENSGNFFTYPKHDIEYGNQV